MSQGPTLDAGPQNSLGQGQDLKVLNELVMPGNPVELRAQLAAETGQEVQVGNPAAAADAADMAQTEAPAVNQAAAVDVRDHMVVKVGDTARDVAEKQFEKLPTDSAELTQKMEKLFAAVGDRLGATDGEVQAALRQPETITLMQQRIMPT